ncbi:homeobox protein prospero [Caerostris extrusa]|uniref:Homeobox protein prospero n=1 Tax=Caerostris extrusa TaxID=172846 RepID=A0AAV4X7T2_CAEEX|nr:homeobox protein prospero [Caerostris extrusa]
MLLEVLCEKEENAYKIITARARSPEQTPARGREQKRGGKRRAATSAGMMSSEGEGEAEELKAKTRRVRQRVDAGEPRNSYASIPNFSSRPPGSFGNGFAATRMLCDLIGSGLRGLPPPANGEMFERSPERCSSGGSSSSHLLRDILQQGRNGGGEGARTDTPVLARDRRRPAGGPAAAEKGARRDHREQHAAGAPARQRRAHPPPPPSTGARRGSLYQPQQHERTSVDGAGAEVEDDDDETLDPSTSPLLKRRNGGAGLLSIRQQLRHMQQQLVVMQHKYMEMVDGGDSTDEEQTKSRDSCEDIKPLQNFADDDNASMYDDARRLIIDDRKDTIKPQQHEGATPENPASSSRPTWITTAEGQDGRCAPARGIDAQGPDPAVPNAGPQVASHHGQSDRPGHAAERPADQQPLPATHRAAQAPLRPSSSPLKPPPVSPPRPPSSTGHRPGPAMVLQLQSKRRPCLWWWPPRKKRHKVTDTRLQQRDVSPKYPEHLPPPVPPTTTTSSAGQPAHHSRHP